MDSQIVNRKAEEYKDRSLRITPTLLPHLGLVKKSIYLRVDAYQISCFPFDLSLTKASLLVFLSEKEIDFFTSFIDKPHKLFMSLTTPYSARPVDFFLTVKIQSFRKPDASSIYCIIDVQFIQSGIPLVFKEFLVTYFQNLEEAERFIQEAPESDLSEEQIEQVVGSLHMSIFGSNKNGVRLRILSLSTKSLKVFGEFGDAVPKEGERLDLESWEGNDDCVLQGECLRVLPSGEAPGFFTVEMKLQFCPYMVRRIQEAVGWTSKKIQ